jgi:hypothetical protein
MDYLLFSNDLNRLYDIFIENEQKGLIKKFDIVFMN